jgi:uncharacterized protein YkwD
MIRLFVVLLCFCSTVLARDLEPESQQIHFWEQQIVDYTNQQRVRNGLQPVVIDWGLMRSARQHTLNMIGSGYRHSGQNCMENIAYGQDSSYGVVLDWYNSPGHRANMLNSSVCRIGVSVYRSLSGQHYYTQQFLP